jgi:hypothetical protein
MQVTAWEVFLIQLDQVARLHGGASQTFFFFLRPVAPKNLVRLAKGGDFLHPFLNMWICGNRTCGLAHELTIFPFLN